MGFNTWRIRLHIFLDDPWFHVGIGRPVGALMVMECLLWLSNRVGWWYKGLAVLTCLAVVGVFLLMMLLWFAVALVLRERFQFGIRSLLSLTLAVALPFSWLAVEIKSAREQREAVDAIEKLTGDSQRLRYDLEFNKDNHTIHSFRHPAWLCGLMGDDFFEELSSVDLRDTAVTDAWLAHVTRLTGLRTLVLGGTQVTDAGMAQLAGLTQLRGLNLRRTHVTDAGLVDIARMTKLQGLSLNDTQVTDEGLKQLARLTQLRSLELSGTQITDAGLAHIAGLTQLQDLEIGYTQVSDEGLKHLARLTQLECLVLSGTQVTDAGLVHIARLCANSDRARGGERHAGLTRLRWLHLEATQVTGEGVKKLRCPVVR